MNIQQLRAQIVALQDATLDENNNFRTSYDAVKFDTLTAVINLLDSMQEEPISEELDLEKEIDKEIETRWRGEYLFTSKFRESAKHFFELGLKAQKEVKY